MCICGNTICTTAVGIAEVVRCCLLFLSTCIPKVVDKTDHYFFSSPSSFCCCPSSSSFVHRIKCVSKQSSRVTGQPPNVATVPSLCSTEWPWLCKEGAYCIEKLNKCSHIPLCKHQDGFTENEPLECLCGSTACNDGSGYVCDSGGGGGTGTCSPSMACSNNDGTEKNDGKCSCGNTLCSVASGLWCTVGGDGGGTCAKNEGYILLQSGTCETEGVWLVLLLFCLLFAC